MRKLTDVCIAGKGGGGGENWRPPTIQTIVKFHAFEEQYIRYISTNYFLTWQVYLFKRFLCCGVDGFFLTRLCQKLKKTKKKKQQQQQQQQQKNVERSVKRVSVEWGNCWASWIRPIDFRALSCTKRQFLLSVKKGKERTTTTTTKIIKKGEKRKEKIENKKRKERLGFWWRQGQRISNLNISQVSGHNVLYQCQDICNSI